MNTVYNIVVPYVKSPILSCSIFQFSTTTNFSKPVAG